MTLNLRIAIYGPPDSGKSLLLRRIYELYREASVHEIRYMGGGRRTGVDYCAFIIGDIKYEFYAPPGASYAKVFRNRIIKNADGIIFVIPPVRSRLERVASFMLDLKRLLFEKHRSLSEKFPMIYAFNYSGFFGTDGILEPHEIVRILNMPEGIIVHILNLDQEQTIRNLFGRIAHLTFLWRSDRKKYYAEYDRLARETSKIIMKPEKEAPSMAGIEAQAQVAMEAPSGSQAPPEPPSIPPVTPSMPQIPASSGGVAAEGVAGRLRLLEAPEELKRKMLANYIHDAVIIDFDRAIGHIPLGYIFGHGKVVVYLNDPAFLVELSIIAKHSLGFILQDGLTFVGLVTLRNQGLVVLETTISHMKKILGIVRRLNKKMGSIRASEIDKVISTLNRLL